MRGTALFTLGFLCALASPAAAQKAMFDPPTLTRNQPRQLTLTWEPYGGVVKYRILRRLGSKGEWKPLYLSHTLDNVKLAIDIVATRGATRLSAAEEAMLTSVALGSGSTTSSCSRYGATPIPRILPSISEACFRTA